MHRLDEFLAILLVVIGILWIYQFIQLMLLPDLAFPGHYDKALWVGAFVLAFPLAPLASFCWKIAYREMCRNEGAAPTEALKR